MPLAADADRPAHLASPLLRNRQLRSERVVLGMLDRVDGEVDVEVGPGQVARRRPLELQDRGDRRLSEPGELIEGEEEFAAIDEQPKAVLGS